MITNQLTTNDYGFIAVAESITDSNIWHQRLGYISGKELKIMHLNGKLSGLELDEINMCENYIFEKQ